MALKSSKIYFFEKYFFLLILCHNEPTCQKLCLYVEWCGLWPIQRQRGKNVIKAIKMSKMKISKSGNLFIFSHSPKEHISKEIGC